MYYKDYNEMAEKSKTTMKTTMKIFDTTYRSLQEVRIDCTRCKYNDDTIKMLIRFYRMNKIQRARKTGDK